MLNKQIFFGALCLCISAVASAAQKVSLDSRVGIVSSTDDNKVCLAIQNKTLKQGRRVGVIFAEPQQSFRYATVLSKTSKSCSSDIDIREGVSFYFLQMKRPDYPWTEFGVVGLTKPKRTKGKFHSDIDRDGKQDYFRRCTSNEGVHLTVWNGVPLKGKRIWHRYYYLRYETVPTCKKKDYFGT